MFSVKGSLKLRGQLLKKCVAPRAVSGSHFCPFRAAVKMLEKLSFR